MFAAMGLIWGIPYLMIKVAVEGVPVPVLVFTRTGLGALLLFPFAARPGALATVRRFWLPLVAFAAVEMIGPWFLLTDAERKLSSSMSGLLIAAVPVIGAVLVRVTGGSERLTRVRWIGLLLGLGGVALLAAPAATGGTALSVGEVFLTALGYAIGPMIADRYLREVPSMLTSAVCLGIAAVAYAPFAGASWPHHVPQAKVLWALAGLSVLCTAAAFVIFFALIAEIGPARAMLITYLNPAVVVVAGVLVLGESLTANMVISFPLILAGCWLATRAQGGGRKQAPDPEPAETGPALEPAPS
jgi:drug/metabolite transporter (DMT)-like permease